MFIKPHGVMFHHFHGQQHPISQGSLDSDQFEAKVHFLIKNFNLLSPTEFTQKVTNNKIGIRDICLTFDDALKSQFDIYIRWDTDPTGYWKYYGSVLTNTYTVIKKQGAATFQIAVQVPTFPKKRYAVATLFESTPLAF